MVVENTDLLAFTNGVYEIITKLFRGGRKEDYIRKKSKFKFPVY